MKLNKEEAEFLIRLLGHHVSFPRRDEDLYSPLMKKLEDFLEVKTSEELNVSVRYFNNSPYFIVE